MKRCSRCKKEIYLPNAQICPYCGSKEFGGNTGCTVCGQALADGYNFCPNCGSRAIQAAASHIHGEGCECGIKESLNVSVYKWLDYTDKNIFKDCGVRRNSSFSYCITDTRANDLRIIKKYKVKPNTVYVASVDVKTENVVNAEGGVRPKGVTIGIGSNNLSRSLFGTNDWQTLRVVAGSDEGGNLELSLNLGYTSSTCSGTAWFENVRITPASEYKSGATWKFLAVILKNTAIDAVDETTGERLNLSHVMSAEEVFTIKNSLQRLQREFGQDLNGLCNLEVEILESDAKCTDYTTGASGFKIAAPEAHDYLKRNGIDPAKYDHVIFVTVLPSLPTKYYGLGGLFITGRTGFSFIIHTSKNNPLEFLEGKRPGSWPPGIFVHEFLHSIENYSSILKLPIPRLHDGKEHGYSDNDDWHAWYRDYVNKRVSTPGGTIGVDPIVWSLPPSKFN